MTNVLSTHRFEVRVSGGRIDVAEVSAAAIGLTEDGKPSTENVVIRRALEADPQLFAWWQRSLSSPAKRPTVRIALLGATDKPVITWILRHARAVRWSAPPLNALEGTPAMEELHVAYRDLEVET